MGGACTIDICKVKQAYKYIYIQFYIIWHHRFLQWVKISCRLDGPMHLVKKLQGNYNKYCNHLLTVYVFAKKINKWYEEPKLFAIILLMCVFNYDKTIQLSYAVQCCAVERFFLLVIVHFTYVFHIHATVLDTPKVDHTFDVSWTDCLNPNAAVPRK